MLNNDARCTDIKLTMLSKIAEKVSVGGSETKEQKTEILRV